MSTIERRIAEKVHTAGGRVYYVGGFVRDRLLGTDSKDVDIEVHGIEPERLFELLKTIGEPLAFGESFGVFSLKGENIDIALPRKEHATGRGHRDFEISVDPFLGPEKAARRRDFTINSMMQDVLTGEIIDPFGGREDLEAGIIRHIDDSSFIEDPLRVLRAAQFASRYGFRLAEETAALCSKIDLSYLSRERVEEELKKALLKGGKPSVFFEVLRSLDQLDTWLPELKDCIGLEQDPVYHPEGDVWTHTMQVIDRGAQFRSEVSDAYSFMLLCLTHDLGKIATTETVNGRIHAYRHETEGLPLIETFLRRLTNESRVIDYVLNMVPLHMKPNVTAYSGSSIKSTNRMFDAAASAKDLIYFSMADKPVMAGEDPFSGNPEFLFERLKIYEETMARPYVMGRDLIEAGLPPSEDFSELLSYAHKLRLAGVEKDAALKQVLAQARKLDRI